MYTSRQVYVELHPYILSLSAILVQPNSFSLPFFQSRSNLLNHFSVQVITVNELALRKYMYHSQKSYIDRVRMRREQYKLLFLLYWIYIQSVVGDIFKSGSNCQYLYVFLILISRQKRIVEYLFELVLILVQRQF